MSENNKSYRIRTNVGSTNNGAINLNVNLLQDYDIFEILSLKIDTENLYHLHTAKYGCLVGRVVANGGVGVPNAKLSVFIEADSLDLNDPVLNYLYPYTSTRTKNRDDIRYNLLTDQKIDDCHQDIGTFPNKRLVLDDNNYIEIFDKYYKYTTTTNGAGDYMIFGLPVGNNIIHTDLDLSDIGILSQKPRDLFYKGYSATQFENASQFKKDTNLDNLTQVYSQDSSVYVYPFWGDETENAEQIKITRNDVDINYKFEPTCIFIGSIVSDEKSNAISKNCIPSERMGKMDRLTTGRGTIEMIRKTLADNVESIAIQGNELIDGNGTWCYQIPMNLDYMKTDEYGNLVPTNDTETGIPTRARVRFRVSLADYESDYENTHLVKVLVPNNPTISEKKEDDVTTREVNYDYEFGSSTSDESFRDLFWNNVYTVKSYIPRIQKGNRQRNKNFTGFKAVNVNGANNPIPYNNMRINLTFLFVFQCLIFKSLVMVVKIINKIIYIVAHLKCESSSAFDVAYITIDGGVCPNLEGNYVAPGAKNEKDEKTRVVIKNTYEALEGGFKVEKDTGNSNVKYTGDTFTSDTATAYDPKSADSKNSDYDTTGSVVKITNYTDEYGQTEEIKVYYNEDYFIKCVELQFAMEYEVIQFDFYNDWINGTIYIPRWFAEARKNKDGMVYCGENFTYSRNLVQQCALGYKVDETSKNITVESEDGCGKKGNSKQRCHKIGGRKYVGVFGAKNRGIVERLKTSKGHYVYYLRPSEIAYSNKKANLFATDLVLLGSVNKCNQYGLPTVNGYTSSSYIMPPPTGEIIYDTQEMETENKIVTKYVGEVTSINEQYKSITYTDEVNIKINTNDLLVIERKGNYGPGYFICAYAGLITDGTLYLNTIDNIYVGAKISVVENITEIGTIGEITGGTVDGNKAACITLTDNAPIPEGLDKNDQIVIPVINLTQTVQEVDRVNNRIWVLWGSEQYGAAKKTPIYGPTKYALYTFNKVPLSLTNTEGEKPYSELSGIDWGYNPYKSGGGHNAQSDDTSFIINQVTGHFLEIGCTYSLSNVKSCVNLSRICEIGSEMSQSHYYKNSNDFVRPAGLIGKREINNEGIRTTFTTLNSNGLKTGVDTKTGYLRYNFNGYVPNTFMGELTKTISKQDWSGLTSEDYGFVEGNSKSYKAFRFGTTDLTRLTTKFLVESEKLYYMPVFENSLYFYFGLKDGSTAIDRLYSEYYAECP